jgi:imidazolonepropionase-like amidohydrolase
MQRAFLLVVVVLVACGGTSVPESSSSRRDRATVPPLPWAAAESEPRAVESPLIAITGGTVMTAAGPIYERGVVVMEDGVLVAVGREGDVEIPEGATVIDAEGKFVTPGVIDTHSHMGVYAVPDSVATQDGNEATDPVTAEVWAADSFWPQDAALTRAIEAGVTTIQVLPGSANLIGGRGVILKLHLGRSAREMWFRGAPDTLKMACGENPKRVYGEERETAPSTRMGNVAGYRAAFQEAIEYALSFREWQENHRLWQDKRRKYEEAEREGTLESEDAPEDPGPAPTPPDRDFGLEVLLGAIEGRVLVQIHCYRADEMLRMIELGHELGFSIRSFHHAVEAYKIRDVLAREEVAINTWADWWGFKLEAFDTVEENLALVTEAGALGVLHSDSAILGQRLNQEVAKAMTAGRRAGIEIDENQALRWITANAAWVLGIEERTGTLEAGKMADVVVWSGHPFSIYSRAERVYIDGELVHDRAHPIAPTDFELGIGPNEVSPVERPR